MAAQCQVWVQRPDGSWSGATFGCPSEAKVGDVLTVRMLAVPDGALVGDTLVAVAVETLVGLAALGLIGRQMTMARRAVRSRAVTLRPMLASAPGLDNVVANPDSERARRLPLEELAAASRPPSVTVSGDHEKTVPLQAVAAWWTFRTALFMVVLTARVTRLFTAGFTHRLGAGAGRPPSS